MLKDLIKERAKKELKKDKNDKFNIRFEDEIKIEKNFGDKKNDEIKRRS